MFDLALYTGKDTGRLSIRNLNNSDSLNNELHSFSA